MFEYLMPLLVMPTYDEHAARPDLPRGGRAADRVRPRSAACRGASPSRGYNATDAQLNYQYRAFGVPGLGLKRGLAEDLVVAPYATRAGADGRARGGVREPAAAGRARASPARYGFYEAIDYTPARAAARADERASCARSWRTTRA